MTIAVKTTNEQLSIKTKLKVLFVEGVGKAFLSLKIVEFSSQRARSQNNAVYKKRDWGETRQDDAHRLVPIPSRSIFFSLGSFLSKINYFKRGIRERNRLQAVYRQIKKNE